MNQQIMTPCGPITITQAPTPQKSPVKLSRLYGYLIKEGKITSVPHEIQLISHVIYRIATSNQPITLVIHQIVMDFGTANIRNRSGKRWTQRTVIGLVRPIYGGRIRFDGELLFSEYYPEIVPWQLVRKALERVKCLRL